MKARNVQLLDRLRAGETSQVLRALLARHPALAEAEELAKSVVTDVDVQAIADDVEQAVLDLDLDDLNARAGRKSWGYVDSWNWIDWTPRADEKVWMHEAMIVPR
jgi:hypothetical protein